MLHWLAHFFGTDNLSGSYYGFWSGIGSDIAELSLFGALVAHYRAKTCHVDRCWRIGRHDVGDYRVCRRHHPTISGTTTPQDVAEAADAQVRAGAGSNPAVAGLPADERMVPPAAGPRGGVV